MLEYWFKNIETIQNQLFQAISNHYSILPVFHLSKSVAARHSLLHIDGHRLEAPEFEPIYSKQTSCRWVCNSICVCSVTAGC